MPTDGNQELNNKEMMPEEGMDTGADPGMDPGMDMGMDPGMGMTDPMGFGNFDMGTSDLDAIEDATKFKPKDFKSDNTEKDLGKHIKPVLKPKAEIGIDQDNTILQQIVAESTQIDANKLQSLTQVSQNRETIMRMLDSMAEDATIGAVLSVYADDVTEPNDRGQVMWAESDDAETAKYIQYLLDVMNVDKHLYEWTQALILYGDLYLKLFRESDIEDSLFDDKSEAKKAQNTLNEAVYVSVKPKNDKYIYYIEAVSNPSEMFELTKFGKSYAYIKADVRETMQKDRDSTYVNNTVFKYQFNKNDVTVFQPTDFVHAYLNAGTNRFPEEIELFIDNERNTSEYDLAEEKTRTEKLTYKVRRGQSLFYNVFKIWRIMMLLQNSMLLNRLTRSSVIRIIGVEVPDGPKENQRVQLLAFKQLFEQKSAIREGESLTEYTNPGPMENNIFVPTHDGQGAVTINSTGGDSEVKNMADVDFFRNLLFGALGLPKEYFGFDENGGFDGGTSLSLKSSRYAKTVKRIQNSLIQALTDVINLILINNGQKARVNKFSLHMQSPSTVEANDRMDAKDKKMSSMRGFVDILDSIQTPSIKLAIEKELVSHLEVEPEILTYIEKEIENLKKAEALAELQTNAELQDTLGAGVSHFGGGGLGGDFGSADFGGGDFGGGAGGDFDMEPASEPAGGEGALPSPADLGAGDLTDANFEA